MKKRAIRIVIILGTFSITGIILIQIYWVQKAFDLNEKQFNESVMIALKNVAEKMAQYNHVTLSLENPVNQVSSNYFVANVNSEINANILDYYLRYEFDYMHIKTDFEYGIYDCNTNKMMYGNYVSSSNNKINNDKKTKLPTYNKYTYYFGVCFPEKKSSLISTMEIWILTSGIMILIIIFFSYSLFIILKQRMLSEIQKDFINNMTHEFKTPLSTISISANVLSKPEIAGEPQRLLNYATIIKNESQRLTNHVEKILQLTRIDKKEFNLHLEIVDAHDIIKNAAKNILIDHKFIDEKIHLDFHAEHPEIKADKTHFTNLVYNLFDNAVKYAQNNIEIEVESKNQKNSLWLCFKDKGIGIKKEHQKKIFERFYRVPTGNIHNVKGFGIGLHYVKIITDAHRWQLKLESKENEGSKFTIIIPQENGI